MNALIIDTETTGLDPSQHRVVEVACTLYSVVHAAPLACFSSLIHAPSNEAEAINGISLAMLAEAPPVERVWPFIQRMAERADCIVAHRADFDRSFCPAIATVRPWVCSKFDCEWPKGQRGDHLVHLALAHGVPVFTAHRAMADVDTLVRLFQRAAFMGHDVERMLVRGMRPKSKFIAQVSYDDRDKAKAAGFAWQPETKQWVRDMPKEDAETLPFPVREVA